MIKIFDIIKVLIVSFFSINKFKNTIEKYNNIAPLSRLVIIKYPLISKFFVSLFEANLLIIKKIIKFNIIEKNLKIIS